MGEALEVNAALNLKKLRQDVGSMRCTVGNRGSRAEGGKREIEKIGGNEIVGLHVQYV